MLVKRLRRWPSIMPTLEARIVFAGVFDRYIYTWSHDPAVAKPFYPPRVS